MCTRSPTLHSIRFDPPAAHPAPPPSVRHSIPPTIHPIRPGKKDETSAFLAILYIHIARDAHVVYTTLIQLHLYAAHRVVGVGLFRLFCAKSVVAIYIQRGTPCAPPRPRSVVKCGFCTSSFSPGWRWCCWCFAMHSPSGLVLRSFVYVLVYKCVLQRYAWILKASLVRWAIYIIYIQYIHSETFAAGKVDAVGKKRSAVQIGSVWRQTMALLRPYPPTHNTITVYIDTRRCIPRSGWVVCGAFSRRVYFSVLRCFICAEPNQRNKRLLLGSATPQPIRECSVQHHRIHRLLTIFQKWDYTLPAQDQHNLRGVLH